MSVEPIESIIKLWETGQITLEQAIGKILLWLRQHETRLRKLEVPPPHSEANQ